MAAKHGGRRNGAGRKPKKDELEQSAFFDKYLPAERRIAILNHMLEIALGDNAKAAVTAGSLLLAYSFGKPMERVQHSNPDGSNLLSPVADALTKVYGASNTVDS